MRARPDNPQLHTMLRRIIQDERRHFAFYRAQAQARLATAPPGARRLVRWILKNLWTPVGAGVKSQEEVGALALYMFADDEGREQLRGIDRTISEMPGLEGLTFGRGRPGRGPRTGAAPAGLRRRLATDEGGAAAHGGALSHAERRAGTVSYNRPSRRHRLGD